jgi:hypothetical protein
VARRTLRRINTLIVGLALVGGLSAFALTPAPAYSTTQQNCLDPRECTAHTGGMEVCEGDCPSPTSICCVD